MSTSSLTAIVAATVSNGIGKDGGLPWRLAGEMKYFQRVTMGENQPEGSMNAVLMGRKTWESIPAKFKPLRGRRNLVISRQGIDVSGSPNSSSHTSLDEALASLRSKAEQTPKTFLIGGAQLYNLALTSSPPTVDRVLLTRVSSPSFECDTFLDPFTEHHKWEQASHAQLSEYVGFEVPIGDQTEKDVTYRYEMWVLKDKS